MEAFPFPLILGYSDATLLKPGEYIELTSQIQRNREVWFLLLGPFKQSAANTIASKLETIYQAYVLRQNPNWVIALPTGDIVRFGSLLQSKLNIDSVVNTYDATAWTDIKSYEPKIIAVLKSRLNLEQSDVSGLLLVPYLVGGNLETGFTLMLSYDEEAIQMPWYVPLEEAVTVNLADSPDDAYGILNRKLIKNGKPVSFRHLLVVDDNKQVVGIVTKSTLHKFLTENPLSQPKEGVLALGTVQQCMIPRNEILTFPHSMTLEGVHKILKEDDVKWEIFIRSGIIFVGNEQNEIVGFETERGLW